MIVGFAVVAPFMLVLLWQRAPLAGLAVLALSHALLLYPTLLPNVQWLGPVVTRFTTQAREVWLTIDDGPSADTAPLLDLLDTRGARVTFFVKGSLAERQEGLVRMIVARGHQVANHSQTHPSGTFWCLFPATIAAEIEQCNEVLRSITGHAPRLFRAPVGMKNPGVHPQLRKRGMQLVGWTVRGFDSIESDPEKVAARILSRVTPGAIIVMHQGRDHSLDCIARVLDELLGLGYVFVVPDEGRLKTNR
jgi:peptidoglycan/xylan/chitin deacetylase (PgdA/CDA1 family)